MIIILVLFSFSACKKKAEETISQAPLAEGPIMDTPSEMPPHGTGQKVQFEVVVPPEVEDSWAAVKLEVMDKQLNKTQEYTVKLGEALEIPDSDLTIKAEYFLPDFKMSGQIVTSGSNAPNNPAVGVVILENGDQIFPEPGRKLGWLYAKFPTVHQFDHARFGLVLKEGVRKE
ncbi:MAG TPA: hypothetical protein ENG75_05135 [Nitrospirae bacterium]|nr:hypothetical protein [Nitrospirota bacterium]